MALNSIGLSLRRRSRLAPAIPAQAGIRTVEAKFATRNHVQIEANGSLPPLRGKARMGDRRAQARLRGRDARAPRLQTFPCKPFKGEGWDGGDARKPAMGADALAFCEFHRSDFSASATPPSNGS